MLPLVSFKFVSPKVSFSNSATLKADCWDPCCGLQREVFRKHHSLQVIIGHTFQSRIAAGDLLASERPHGPLWLCGVDGVTGV